MIGKNERSVSQAVTKMVGNKPNRNPEV